MIGFVINNQQWKVSDNLSGGFSILCITDMILEPLVSGQSH